MSESPLQGSHTTGWVMPSLLVALTSLLVMTGASRAAQGDTLVRAQDGDLASVASPPPADHPVGTNASVSLVSLKRAPGLSQPIFSTYIVAYAPGGSAVLHRSPSTGLGSRNGRLSHWADLGRARFRQRHHHQERQR